MTDHENLTVRLWDVIHDARYTPSDHAPTSAIVAAVLPILAGEVRAASRCPKGPAMEDRPSVTLAAIRRLAHNAHRRGTRIDPRVLLDIIEGKKA